MKFDLEKFQREQKGPCPPVARADLGGKVIAVIGASTGLGFEASKHFASMNPGKLVLGVRSREKGEIAVKGLLTFINYHHHKVSFYLQRFIRQPAATLQRSVLLSSLPLIPSKTSRRPSKGRTKGWIFSY
jgi:hypothetical protein